jgi:predicted transport protein
VTKTYVAYRRLRNFACVALGTRDKVLWVYANLPPAQQNLSPGFTRDVSAIGHIGTGDVEITIRSTDDLERAKPLLIRSFQAS